MGHKNLEYRGWETSQFLFTRLCIFYKGKASSLGDENTTWSSSSTLHVVPCLFTVTNCTVILVIGELESRWIWEKCNLSSNYINSYLRPNLDFRLKFYLPDFSFSIFLVASQEGRWFSILSFLENNQFMIVMSVKVWGRIQLFFRTSKGSTLRANPFSEM